MRKIGAFLTILCVIIQTIDSFYVNGHLIHFEDCGKFDQQDLAIAEINH